jgi:N-methylhydantoinase B
VAGGNVETSQRVVDLVLKALGPALPEMVPAQSAGTMTNLTLGGWDPRTGGAFSYYETVGGGMGASPAGPGLSGVHTHMTNSLNTPVEALEQAYPLEVVRYALRRGSGGPGRHRGGDGILREIRVRVPCEVSLLSDRQRYPPAGRAGGKPGQPGRAWVVRNGRRRAAGSKATFHLEPGDSVRLATPAGGGWGRRGDRGRRG